MGMFSHEGVLSTTVQATLALQLELGLGCG